MMMGFCINRTRMRNHNYLHWLTNTEKEKIVYAIKEELQCITKSSPNIRDYDKSPRFQFLSSFLQFKKLIKLSIELFNGVSRAIPSLYLSQTITCPVDYKKLMMAEISFLLLLIHHMIDLYTRQIISMWFLSNLQTLIYRCNLPE